MSESSTLSPQQKTVLEAIEGNPKFGYFSGARTIWSAAFRSGYPEASVRRTLRELRLLGYNISYAVNGVFHYRPAQSNA